MAQWLKILPALPGNPSTAPSAHLGWLTIAGTPAPGDQMLSLTPGGTLTDRHGRPSHRHTDENRNLRMSKIYSEKCLCKM